MKITVKETIAREVVLSRKQQNNIAISVLEKHFDLKRLDRVVDGKLEREIEYQGHRTWWDWEVQRDANSSDEYILQLLDELHNKEKE